MPSLGPRLNTIPPSTYPLQGWLGRDVALTIALVEAGVIVVGLYLLAWHEGIDILTDDYQEAFKVRTPFALPFLACTSTTSQNL